MTSMLPTQYKPDSVSPPGDSLLDTLEALGMTQTELSERSGLAPKTVNHIISGKASISETTALLLERVLGTPAHFWLVREAKYREFLARKNEKNLKESHQDWARAFPYKQMADLGWIEAASKAGDKAMHLLSFFAVSDQDCWSNVWTAPEASFRQTTRVGKKPEVISAWLRKGEIDAQKLRVPAFDEKRFSDAIHSLRSLVCEEDPHVFIPEIEKRCAQAGVRFLVIRELPSLGVYGVTRWYAGSPMIQQSMLLKSHDHFWFTFFHEAKHVLQKVKKRIFLEGTQLDQEDQKREDEANQFAGELLIPEKEYVSFLDQNKFTTPSIRKFAASINAHPGIVVGRLMRDKRLSYTHPARRLQVRYQWGS